MQEVEQEMRAYMKTNKVTVDKNDIDAVLIEALEDWPIEREMSNIQVVPLNFEPYA